MKRRELLAGWHRRLVALGVCLAFMGLPGLAFGQNIDAPDVPPPGADDAGAPREGFEVDTEAPDIAGEDIDGVRFKLSDYRGKVVMLDFWGDW